MLNPLAEAIREGFSGENLKQFQEQGYCILKDVLKPEAAQKYLDEILLASKNTTNNNTSNNNNKNNHNNNFEQNQQLGRFSPNKVEFLLASGPIQLVKPHVFECDLHKPEDRKHLPQFENIFGSHNNNNNHGKKEDEKSSNSLVNLGDAEQITHIVNERFPEMQLANTFNATNHDENKNSTQQVATSSSSSSASSIAQFITLKLQINNGGAFPLHHDNPGKPNKRKLTLALYLTKKWTEASHGGQLVLQPFLGQEVVIPPVFNTLALFRSDLISHRVMPAKLGSTRYCFTIWFDSLNVNADDEVNLRAKHLTREFIPTLKISPIHRSLMRAVYDEEFRSSLKDCFGEGTKELMISLKMHEAHTAPLMKNAAVADFVKILRELK